MIRAVGPGTDVSGDPGVVPGTGAVDPNRPDIAALIAEWVALAEPPENAITGGGPPLQPVGGQARTGSGRSHLRNPGPTRRRRRAHLAGVPVGAA